MKTLNPFYIAILVCLVLFSCKKDDNDTEAPVIVGCLSVDSVQADENCLFTIPDYTSQLLITDNEALGQEITIQQVPASGSQIASCDTSLTISVSATDLEGNRSTCTFELISSEDDVAQSSDERVIILCEGAFNGNNASVSVYEKNNETLVNGAFEAVNGYSPGDILQSASAIDNRLYLTLNNSGKIEVADANSFLAESPINGLISPREMLPIGFEKAYVTNLFSNSIQIVDLASKTVSGAIDIGGWSEGIVSVGDKVYVSKSNGDKVIVIDSASDEVTDSIAVTPGPVNMALDSDGNIWLACNGNFGAVDPKIHKIDPQSDAVIGTYDISEPYSYTIKLAINGPGDQIYVLNNGVYTMFIGDNELSTDAIVPATNSFYGLGLDPSNGDIYTSDAGDFNSPGTVSRYSESGMLIDEFQVGIAPNGFVFYY